MQKIKQKIFLTILALFISTSTSYATGAYIGVDALFASASHKAKNSTNSVSGALNGSKTSDDRFNFGANVGVRLDVLNLLVSGELFYDDLRTSAKNVEDASGGNNPDDNIKLKNRYGVKANAGFAIFPGVTPFLTYGLTKVNYVNNLQASQDVKIDKAKLTPLYGVGVLVDLPITDLSLKATYDYQNFNIRYDDPSSKIKTHLNTVKVGVMYNF